MPQRYVHLMPEERPIWERFISAPPVPFIREDYDVHLGKGAELPPDSPEYMVRQAAAVTRKRVDVVVETPDEVWIVEIKPRCDMSPLGQLLNYKRLYEKEYAPTKPVRMVVVCERIAPDVTESYRAADIPIYVV